LKKADRPVSEVCHRFDPLPQILKNVRTGGGKVLDDPKVAKAIEGARKQLGDSGRLVIRPSGTEPVIRVMAEGDDRVSVETAVDEVIEAITKAA
ncbi:phosphoglucosamine mutase, partial [Labrys portucalensis]